MSDSKFLKILYAIICFMLLAFFGCGGYFISQGVYGAGLIAIGIGIIGFGVALFLGTGLLFAVDDASAVRASKGSKGKAALSGKALMRNVVYTLHAYCDCRWFNHVPVEISVSDVGFVVQSTGQEPLYVRFADILRVAFHENQFLVMGNIEREMQFVQEAIVLTIDNKMKCKMFEKTLLGENIEFADASVAQSIIADVQENRTESRTPVTTERCTIKKRG